MNDRNEYKYVSFAMSLYMEGFLVMEYTQHKRWTATSGCHDTVAQLYDFVVKLLHDLCFIPTAYYFATVISVAFITVLTTTCTLRLYHNNGRKPLPSLLKRLKRDVSSKQDGCLPKSSTKSSTSMNG